MVCVIPLLLLVSNALALMPAEKPYYDLADAEKHFSDFIQKYGKSYKTDKEYHKRFEIFKSQLGNINLLNENNEASYAVNAFTDLTHEEFAESYLGLVPSIPLNATNKIKVKQEWIDAAPDSLDYRTQNLVTHVKDQGGCGSCYIFSAVGNIEGQYAKKHKELIALSEQQGLDCDKVDGGCNGGFTSNAMTALAQQAGCEREEDYPYEAVVGTCHTDASKAKVKVIKVLDIDTPSDEELKGAVANYGPLAVDLYMPPEAMNYDGGVYSPTTCKGQQPNHAIVVVGYGTDPSGKDYWLIKNSWGIAWGEQGYFKLERGGQKCSIGTEGAVTAEVE